jgi:hypothetical protein
VAIDDARQRIVRAIARSEGPAILIGGAGTGKSLLLAVLAEQFAPAGAVVTLAGAQLCTRRALLQMVLFELGLEYRGMDEGELRLAILSHLRGIGTMPANTGTGRQEGVSRQRAAAAPSRLLLLVDEADALPVRLLEELRVLTNVSAGGVPLVSLVLAGGPTLEERFAEPQLDMFAQRIAARCYLAPLGREETFQYVRSQVAAVGMKAERLFTADALEAIHAATGGVPRLVNQLGDQLVWMAEESGCAPLDAALVQQAWSDLQQLPAPWNSQGAAMASSSDDHGVIEFGELDAPNALPSREATFDLAASLSEFDGDDADDELPASIPMASARPGRLLEAVLDEEDFESKFDETEHLLESFSEFDHLEIRADDPAPAEQDPPAAKDPFAEPFDEEEIVLDPYTAFESELLRTAPLVFNRLDRAFASELHRCVQRAVSETSARGKSPGEGSLGRSSVKSAGSVRVVQTLESVEKAPRPDATSVAPAELLVIDDDEESAAAAVIPGKQFRRLFSSLEANGRLG